MLNSVIASSWAWSNLFLVFIEMMAKDRYSNATEVAYLLIEFMEIKRQAQKFGLGAFDLKLLPTNTRNCHGH